MVSPRNAVTPNAIRAIGLLTQGYQSPDGRVNIPPMPLSAAAALVGSLQQESYIQLDTNASGDAGAAQGLAGWHPDRLAGVNQFQQAYFPQDKFAGQVYAAANELQTKYPSVYATVMSPDATQAQKAWVLGKDYEGAGIVAADARLLNANQLVAAAPAALAQQGVQTITPNNVQDAMVPPSGAAPPATVPDAAATSAFMDQISPQAAAPAPAAPPFKGSSGPPQVVNGIINGNPADVQAGTKQIADDIQAGKTTQDDVKGYYAGLSGPVLTQAKAGWDALSKTFLGAIRDGLYSSGGYAAAAYTPLVASGIKKDLANAPPPVPASDWNALPKAPISAWNVGPDNLINPANKAAQADVGSVYGSLNYSAPSLPGLGDRSLGIASAGGYAPPGPAVPNFTATSAGDPVGLGFSNSATPSPVTNYVRPDASSVTPPPTSWGGPAGSSPLTAALVSSDPAASLTPDTGTGGLTGALAGVSTMAPPPQATTPVPAAPSPRPTTTYVNYTVNSGGGIVPSGLNSGIPGGGGSMGGNSTNAWSGGYYSGAMPGGYVSNYGFGSLGAGQFGNLGAASQYGGGAYGAPNSTT